MWWRPLTPRSSTETKCVHRKMYVIARRPAADAAPSGDSLRSQSVLFKMSEILIFQGMRIATPSCGMVRNDMRYLGTFCEIKNRRAAIAVRRYAYLWSFRAQAKPAPARPVRDTKRIPAHRWMVSPVVGLVPSLAARTWKAVSALPSSK